MRPTLISRARSVTSLVLLLSLTGWAQNSDVHGVAARVDRHYNHLRSMTAEFTETYRGAGADRSESGILYLKKPGRMRWEYTSPRPKLFISDGKQAFFYVPGEPQARKVSLNKLDDLRSPLRYLLGKTKLEKEFDHLALLSPPSPSPSANLVLRGIPRSMTDRVQEVELEINPQSQIVRIAIDGTDGTTTQFDFRDHVENPELGETEFRFTPPNGVQVIEGEAFSQ